MADDAEDEAASREENVLYDLTINAEWPQEPETISRNVKDKSQVSFPRRLASAAQRTAWTFLRTVGIPTRSSSPCSLPVGLVKLINRKLQWQIAVSSDGQQIAVLQDTLIEIRTARDAFDSVLARCSISKDPHVQWRRLCWSTDGTMLAYADSLGNLHLFDEMGAELIYIPCKLPVNPKLPVDLSRAVAALIFTDYVPTSEWTAQLIVVNYQGSLRSLLVNSDSSKYKEDHTFSFSHYYPRGVGTVVYDSSHKLLVVGGCCTMDEDNPSLAEQQGITRWRILSGAPYYKLVTDYEQDIAMAQKKRKFFKKLKSFQFYGWYGDIQDSVYKMCLSPDTQLLVTIHHSGLLSLWEYPSLKLRRMWPLAEQPGNEEKNPIIVENLRFKRVSKDSTEQPNLLDVNWWSKEALILARCSGAVTVSSANTLRNLLGTSPEWLEPSPQVSKAHDGGFLGLECECRYQSLKRRLVDDVAEVDDEYEDSEDEEDATIMTRTKKLIKGTLYYVTDNERFQPPKKRPKILSRTYRLVCLKSTTPEELYSRKIDNEEYGEALALAQAYGLDCDLVYQRQWRRTDVSVASIQDYLSKISKRAWVLHECLERVPQDIDAMKALLEYGLRGTDLEALLAIGKGEDGGRFILCDSDHMLPLEESYDDIETEERVKQEAQRKRREELLKQVDFTTLNLEQKELCRARLKLLQYLYRLSTYEEILGGPHQAEQHFDYTFFQKFRSQNIVEIAADYARATDKESLHIILTYHGVDTLPHRLAILSNFPETSSPHDYAELLPVVSNVEGEPEVEQWPQHEWRDQDWVESDACRPNIDPVLEDPGAFLYEDNLDLERFRGEQLTKGQVRDWYAYRACEIERWSRLVDNALEMVNQAMERNVEGLENLHDDLKNLELLVYDAHVDDSVTFDQFKKMTDIEKLRLLMSKSSEEMYEKNLKKWMLPFLKRCDRQKPGSTRELLEDYLVTMAKDDLTLCQKVFRSSMAHHETPIISEDEELLTVALKCIYSCERSDQRLLAVGILECLPARGSGKLSSKMNKIHDEVDMMERDLSAAEILERNNLPKTMSYIKSSQQDVEETKNLLTKLTRIAGRKTPRLTEIDWKKLLQDVLELQSRVYGCVSRDTCYEIFVESLLCSSHQGNIHLAGQYLEKSADEHASPRPSAPQTMSQYKLPYKTAIELVLQAAREYFDSSASLRDECMDLARSCLSLIGDRPPSIQEDLDLIAAIDLLNDLEVAALPLQVRLCKERLEFVEKAIQKKPTTYKNYNKLLKLGSLLRVSGRDKAEKEGRVLRLVTQAALRDKDFKLAHQLCRRMMESGYAAIWTECKALAEAEEFQDISAKAELLSFAVTHCSADMIEPILRAKCLLETKILYDTIQTQTHQETDSNKGTKATNRSPFSARGALQQTKEILTSTSKTTKSLLTTFSDKQWWKSTLKNLDPQGGPSREMAQEVRNARMEKQGYHPFYEDCIENGHCDVNAFNYKQFSMPKDNNPTTELSEILLRTAKLEETLTEGAVVKSSREVLLKLAKDAMSEDAALGLAYLFALSEITDADKCFTSLPQTAISLQLATYYYALQTYAKVQQTQGDIADQSPVYHQLPSEVVSNAVNFFNTYQGSEPLKAEVHELGKKLKSYNELLEDYVQAQTLKELGRGVDVTRFTKDNEYKQETILGLAMSLEHNVYQLAVSLAQKYDIPLWEVYMTHLEFLFTDSGLSTHDLEHEVQTKSILAVLVSKPVEFLERMQTYVYPSIRGSDHARLLCYYTMLSGCSGEEAMTPEVHVKLLKKIKPAAPGLDYKKLMDGNQKPLEIIKPILTSSNVHVIAKLAAKIPNQAGGYLQPSVVFCAWAIKLFWEGDQNTKKLPESKAEWLHRYESCSQYLEKMSPEDAIEFICGITFVETAVEQLSFECRQEIVRRGLKFCRQEGGKKKKMDDSGCEITWTNAIDSMQVLLNHLDLLTTETFTALRQAEDEEIQSYAKLFDLSRGDEVKLQELLVKILLDGQPIEMVEDLLAVTSIGNWTVNTAVVEALAVITDSYRNPDTASVMLQGKEGLEVLKSLVIQVSEHHKHGGELVNPEDIINLLRPFCADAIVPVEPRLDVLQILEQCFDLTDNDLVLLVLYRTDAIVSTAWEDKKLTEADINCDSARQELFNSLLGCSANMAQYLALSKMLRVWPLLSSLKTSSEDPTNHPLAKLCCAMVECCNQEGAEAVLRICRETIAIMPLSVKCTQHVVGHMLNHGHCLPAVKLCLITAYPDMHSKAVEELISNPQVFEDEELLNLLLKHNLTSKIVSTPYYSLVITYLLSNQNTESTSPDGMDVKSVARQLQEAGHMAEAGSLLLKYRGTHSALRTFDAAVGIVKQWFNN
ncbi:neuroblastoma-amplified sequence [Lingula anatina]|uniref:Neuroblastoma-amplified sequence n=1 Tax=Lingula anatina TaxID=7574 RepID=A0A1S3KGU9_LINAN|nr:neuroblastoma-amplified sequence [Lingula anatina]|eukprot:XP_013421684.1 neuroblastoma-amplified sequence [Lingula anatina]